MKQYTYPRMQAVSLHPLSILAASDEEDVLPDLEDPIVVNSTQPTNGKSLFDTAWPD